jgi:phosphopantothenoylcysteine decarboxylase/phosphopantothenate--cysteine ligase
MLTNKTIVLGITGGIAAYKGADLASKLVQAGAKVRVIMTKNAQKFVTPLTFEAITTTAVITDMFETTAEHRINHVALSEIADAVVIAPATANIMAKLANGMADDMLTTTVLATRAPVIIAPAMHSQMYQSPVTQENEEKLRSRGFHIIPPASGRLASGGYGPGRFPDTEVIIGFINRSLGKKGDLAGKKIVVTSGGTQEPIDPVRVITNRSSGKMGYAIAEAARDRGAAVTLITTPTAITKPVEVEIIPVDTAIQMKAAVEKAVAQTDALIMAAAVADFQVKNVSVNKIKKEKGNITLEMISTPDILSEVDGDFLKIGFAAESRDLLANARKKVEKKHLDLIVANDITEANSGFGTDTNKVTLIGKDGTIESLPLLSKREVADRILDRIVELFSTRTGPDVGVVVRSNVPPE